jgi:hypothetical protein
MLSLHIRRESRKHASILLLDSSHWSAQAITSLPYCAHHAHIAYQPAAERKRLRA